MSRADTFSTAVFSLLFFIFRRMFILLLKGKHTAHIHLNAT